MMRVGGVVICTLMLCNIRTWINIPTCDYNTNSHNAPPASADIAVTAAVLRDDIRDCNEAGGVTRDPFV